MPKVGTYVDEPGSYMIHCPACKMGHKFDQRWTFNGDLEKPTFRASMLVEYVRQITDDEHDRIMRGEKLNIPKTICHSYVTDGWIQFLSDCTHSMAGQMMPLPEFTKAMESSGE